MFWPNRKRLTLMPAVALAALSALVAIPALSQARLFAAAPEHYKTVTVVRGESLWTIADRYTPSGQSVQDTVDTIIATNGLSNASVRAGEHLKIPR